MSAADSTALAFLAPGLLHRFGNTLLAVQGRARLLAFTLEGEAVPAEVIAEDARALVGDADAALRALGVLRWLCGEDSEEVASLRTVVEDVVDVARVPLRDLGATVLVDEAESMGTHFVSAVAVAGPLTVALRWAASRASAGCTPIVVAARRSVDALELRVAAPSAASTAAADGARAPAGWSELADSSGLVRAIPLHIQP